MRNGKESRSNTLWVREEGGYNRYIDGMNSLKDILYKPRVMAAMNFVLHRNA